MESEAKGLQMESMDREEMDRKKIGFGFDQDRIGTIIRKIEEEVQKAVIGKDETIRLTLITFMTGGHLLLEDIPGVGKTLLVRAFARALGLEMKRIQFTPDLLPSDLTGISFYNQKEMDFVFRKGPLFSNIILADEINRATPRTQSSLLEAMEEKQISVDGVTRELGSSFMVLATQNPVESHGTFPLPEAQLDRFFMRIAMGYPDREEEKLIALRDNRGSLETVRPAATLEELELLKEALKAVRITDEVMGYILDIVEHTRKDERTLLGVSPRGSIALTLAAKALALTSGRDHVLPEDVKTMARYTLNHRIILKGQRLRGIYTYMDEVLQKVPVPLEKIEA